MAYRLIAIISASLLLAGYASTGAAGHDGTGPGEPSGDKLCKKMIADGRGEELTHSDCLCLYRVADAVLDDSLKHFVFDSWYNGTNNVNAIQSLPNPNRVKRQLKKMSRTLKRNCKGVAARM